MEDIAELCGVTPGRGAGTASFYDMFHTEPVGRYVVALCTNIACMLVRRLSSCSSTPRSTSGVGVGQTTPDGLFTLEEAECLAGV